MRTIKILVFLLLALLAQEVLSGEPIDKCYFCKTVLQCVYGHFNKSVKSRRQLESRLESTCKRYPHYKMSCLKMTKANLAKIFEDLQPERYDPHQTCVHLQECPQTPATTLPPPPPPPSPAPEDPANSTDTFTVTNEA